MPQFGRSFRGLLWGSGAPLRHSGTSLLSSRCMAASYDASSARLCCQSRAIGTRSAPVAQTAPRTPRRGPRPLGSRGPKYGVALSWMHERVRIMKAVLRTSRAESSGAHFAFSMGPTGGCLLCINCSVRYRGPKRPFSFTHTPPYRKKPGGTHFFDIYL